MGDVIQAHITNGLDHDGTEWTLCGKKVTWTAMNTRQAIARDDWCQECVEKDA